MPKQTPSAMSAEGAQCSCAVGHPAAPDPIDLNDFIDLILSLSLKFLSRPRASARSAKCLLEASKRRDCGQPRPQEARRAD